MNKVESSDNDIISVTEIKRDENYDKINQNK